MRARMLAVGIALLILRLPAVSQVRPVYDLGTAGLVQVLERLQTTASALHTGAHPDDEDTAFIARLARGDNARVAYLSLTRGEGGQNIIGTELAEALGVIRTEELLQARRLDGGGQYFTRAIDFGYTKTRQEAAERWNEELVLGDMVRVIRMFRPLVIYSQFSGTADDGHGQHQLAGHLTPLAFEASADPSRFPQQLAEGLRPWRARKLYRNVGFRPDPAAPATLRLDVGVFDPVLGRYYGEIASEGRSQHKSQEMGGIEAKGPRTSGLIRLDAPGAAESSVFDGIDTSVPGLAALAGLPQDALSPELRAMAGAARRALDEFDPRAPERSIPALAEGLRAVRAARAAAASTQAPPAARAEADFLLAIKEDDFAEALVRAAGVVIDPIADRETIVPGGSVVVTTRVFAPPGGSARVIDASVTAPSGWTVAPDAGVDTARDDSPFARFLRETPAHAARHRVTAPDDAVPTQPYYLDDPRDGDRYRWDDSDPQGLPFAAPLLASTTTLEIGGVRVGVERPAQYRFADRVRGELRRNLHVVPPVTVDLDSRLLIIPTGARARPQRVTVSVTSHRRADTAGRVRLTVPAGWTSSPADAPFTVKSEGDRTSVAFTVDVPAQQQPGTFAIGAEALIDGTAHASSLQVIHYPHIQTHRIYSAATAAAQVFDLTAAAVRVGYVMGSGDEMPEMIRRMGVAVTLLDDEMLATGDLAQFDTIVVGIRATQGRPAFAANHRRLVEFAERGGTLIVQYQQTDYVQRGLPPYPAEMSSRVTDETAPVRMLAPGHPVFTYPNRIGAADFTGWVQERNLYAFSGFDPRYTPLLETADPNEPPQRGGQVYARIGKGHYIYTAYAWFRQLPAGVPGAYRQFANLISLPKAPRPGGP